MINRTFFLYILMLLGTGCSHTPNIPITFNLENETIIISDSTYHIKAIVANSAKSGCTEVQQCDSTHFKIAPIFINKSCNVKGLLKEGNNIDLTISTVSNNKQNPTLNYSVKITSKDSSRQTIECAPDKGIFE